MSDAFRPPHDQLWFLALGGAGEIGMNLNLYGHAGKWLMVDLGITFGDETTPGIDIIMPDPGFIVDRVQDLVGIVLTHAHEDHIGAVPYLWSRLKCPLYATPFTASVLRRKLEEVGLHIERENGTVRVSSTRRLNPIEMTTQPYPGFPTDVQAQLMALLCLADGMSVVSERIFPDRFLHVAELNRMGAHIRKEGATAVIQGVKELQGATVMASDLRASAALVLAAMVARGVTRINRVYHIDRGYEKIEEKLIAVGAQIERVKGQ